MCQYRRRARRRIQAGSPAAARAGPGGSCLDPKSDLARAVFRGETLFMEQVLLPFLRDYQGLKVVIEHVTTQETTDIVRAHAPRVAGTITPHHLMINRTSLFQ